VCSSSVNNDRYTFSALKKPDIIFYDDEKLVVEINDL
jgi:hypothetical protein